MSLYLGQRLDINVSGRSTAIDSCFRHIESNNSLDMYTGCDDVQRHGAAVTSCMAAYRSVSGSMSYMCRYSIVFLIWLYARLFVCVRVCVCVHACVRACVRASARAPYMCALC